MKMTDRATRPKTTFKVLIVDDHPIVRHGLGELIAKQPDLEVCGEASSLREARLAIEKNPPDVAIVDISLDDGSGIKLIEEIASRSPEVKVLVSSIHDEATYAPRAMRAGALGYVEKRLAISRIIDAIRHILGGKIYLSEPMERRLLDQAIRGRSGNQDPLTTLSNRELEVFEMLGQGRNVRQIARELGVSPKTVESHRRNIKHKLELHNSAQLTHRAINWVRDQS
jgi:DNA-binding NarL/FixJ family response regulator